MLTLSITDGKTATEREKILGLVTYADPVARSVPTGYLGTSQGTGGQGKGGGGGDVEGGQMKGLQLGFIEECPI